MPKARSCEASPVAMSTTMMPLCRASRSLPRPPCADSRARPRLRHLAPRPAGDQCPFGRQASGGNRGRPAIPPQGPLRPVLGHRTDRRFFREGHPSPIVARREPPGEQGASHRGHHAASGRSPGDRVHRQEVRGRLIVPRGPSGSEAPPVERRLPHDGQRPRRGEDEAGLDIGASFPRSRVFSIASSLRALEVRSTSRSRLATAVSLRGRPRPLARASVAPSLTRSRIARNCHGVIPQRRHTSASVEFLLEHSRKTCHFCSGVRRVRRCSRSLTCSSSLGVYHPIREGAQGRPSGCGISRRSERTEAQTQPTANLPRLESKEAKLHFAVRAGRGEEGPLAAPAVFVERLSHYVDGWGYVSPNGRDLVAEVASVVFVARIAAEINFAVTSNQVGGRLVDSLRNGIHKWLSSFVSWVWALTSHPEQPDPKSTHRKSNNIIHVAAVGDVSSHAASGYPPLQVTMGGNNQCSERAADSNVVSLAALRAVANAASIDCMHVR